MTSSSCLHFSVLSLLIAFGIILVSGCNYTPTFKAEYDKFRSINEGMDKQEVINTLGEPLRLYSKDNAPTPYYETGYSYKERPITNKVMIYVATEAIAYVYIDDEGKVEEVFVGGS